MTEPALEPLYETRETLSSKNLVKTLHFKWQNA